MSPGCCDGRASERPPSPKHQSIGETLPPCAVCRGLLFQVRIVIVRLPCARQPVTEHHFGDVWLGQFGEDVLTGSTQVYCLHNEGRTS